MVKNTKKLFFSAPERARTVLNTFLECMYFCVYDGHRVCDGRQLHKKLFFSAPERARTDLNAFLEYEKMCMDKFIP